MKLSYISILVCCCLLFLSAHISTERALIRKDIPIRGVIGESGVWQEVTSLHAHKGIPSEEFLSFHLSFDQENLQADKSRGRGDPIEVQGEISFVKGMSGQALFLKDGTKIVYDHRDNLTVPGAISFWVQLHRDRISGKPPQPFEATYFWSTRYQPKGYLGLQDSVYGQLNLWLHHFPNMKQWNVSAPMPWKKDHWFHMLINLHGQQVELFLDGRRIAQAKLERSLEIEELGQFILGHSRNQYAIDELRLFSRLLMPSEVERLALGGYPLRGRIAYLPSLQALVIEAGSDPAMREASSPDLIVTDVDEKQILMKRPLKQEEWLHTAAGILRLRRVVKLPMLREGTYRAWLQETSTPGVEGGKWLKRDFVVKRYEWENNNLGKSDVVIPPFTPLEVSGNKVKSVLRVHDLGGLGLWQQVESLGRGILSRPISLNVTSGGKSLPWKHNPVKILESKPHRVKTEATSSNVLMEVIASGEFDYDGLMKITLQLTPTSPQIIDHLWLEIPVKEEIAILFHAVGEHIRANPAGFIPAGKNIVWESRSLPQSNIDNFIPYIWVGGEERGICWAADWDKDWIHSQERSAVELVRRHGEILIRVNFINGPIQLKRPRAISFALQASPVKPMPQDWRNLVFDFGYPGRGRFPLLWPPSWGGHYGWASRYPLDKDLTYIYKLAETQRSGGIDRDFIEKWIKRIVEHPGPLSHRDDREYVRRSVEYAFRSAKSLYQRDPPGKLLYYSAAQETTELLPENATFNDEWQYFKRMHSPASFRDYAVWYADKMLEAGMGGIYVDNVYLATSFNWAMDEAYIGEDGEVHPSLGIWRLRELIRRLSVMMYEKRYEPLVMAHMTNANMLPVLSFAQVILGWEWKYGATDFQERFTPGYMRAVNIGRQTGTVPLVLDGVTGVEKDSEEFIRLTRTGLALALPHEIFFYSGGKMHAPTAITARDIISQFRSRTNIEAYPYWDNHTIVESDSNLLATVYRYQDNLLLVIGNTGNTGHYAVRINVEQLGLDKLLKAINRESGQSIPVEDNILDIFIKKHDFVLIEATCKGLP